MGYSGGGGGGGGGAGVTVTAAGETLIVSPFSSVTGGNGGQGGDSFNGLWTGGGGGGGGDGIDVIGSAGTTIYNEGTITGGSGGSAVRGGGAGAGGAGISGANLAITNFGTIAGGLAGNSGAQADAIYFTGGVNTLTLETGSTTSGAIELGTGGVSATISAANTGITLGSNIQLDDANAALAIRNDNNLNVSGIISGSGSVTVSGTGTLTLSGVNSYSGETTISSGTLALSGAGSIALSSDVLDNGTLDISGTNSGASVQNLSGSGTVALGSQTLTLTNASGTFSGAFTGTGSLIKEGTGTLILDGNSASFAGTTEIAAGLLEVGDIDNSQAVLGGNVTVDADGTLRGHGTVTGDVSNSGTVAPGGSVGTLTIGGNYTQASNATLSIEVSPTAASKLVVNGSATLNGVLAITYDPGTYSPGSKYTLVSASNGISGEFSSVTTTGTASTNAAYVASLSSSVDYSGNAVELTLSGVIDPVGTSIYTALGTSAILGAQSQNAALLDRLGSASGVTPAPAGWITATGSQTKVGGTNGAPDFRSNRYGFLAGLERRYGDYIGGVAVGYDHTDINEAVTGDSGTTDTLRAALYGARNVGPVSLAATAGAGLDFLTQKRPFGTTGTAEGDHMGQELNVGGQASLPMSFGSVTVTPRVGLRYAYFHANGFDESGAAGQDLNVGTDNVHSLQPYVGVTLDKVFGDAIRPVNAQLRLGYAHELLDANRALSVASQDGTVFTAPGTSLPRGYLTAGASVTLHPLKHLDVSLSYDTLINTTHASAQQGNIRIGYQF
ncbi:autotransporter outer membrane beta-barrel domain-containing protein [Paraburkholderia sp. HP33-1]|uniref:autotransporter outer membrane beta-barrel domain-containing protein n=1 Tax=Paraburkholderia sp. HP33-1 TaxID=2883243 RepID=UPI003FA3C3DF